MNADGDALPDFCDVCPMDPENDADGDGLCESDDNCPVVANPDQSDLDGDLTGDACDPDTDGDGLSDVEEIAIGTDPLDEDSDDDLVCDGGNQVGSCDLPGPDNCPFVANFDQSNGDAFSAGDACQCGDVNSEGGLNAQDLTIVRQSIVGATLSGPLDPDRCDFTGSPGCGVDDAFILDRLLGGKSPPLENACSAYGAP